MRTVKIERIAVVVELSITDCLVLAAAGLHAASDGGADVPYDYATALATGLLGQAFAAYLLDHSGQPETLHGMWDTWAPQNDEGEEPRRIGMPAILARTLDREA